ncbi:MAG: gliding motility-associated-like protein [Saprospiraceae bacterium]|jgi:gliding motility-associated-like protein
MEKLTKTLIAVLISISAYGQVIEAPDLKCITTLFDGNVELEWNLPPANNCGAFQGYRIYATQVASAPYILLATITNQNQTTYTHVNANGNIQTWYYYMTTDLQCPTYQIEFSDIFDNLDPETPPITSVSINTAGNVVLNWETSTSPETNAYVIYRESASGFLAVDTVWGSGITTYEDASVSIDNRQTYTIAAMDDCGNIGLLYDVPHQTISLSAFVNRCEQTLDLTWDSYESWDNPVAAYQIRIGVNGLPLELVKTVDGTANGTSIDGFTDGDQLCITAQAVELNTGYASTTNQVCATMDIVEPMDYIYLSNVSINNDGDLEVFWNWDDDADLESYVINQDGQDLNLAASSSLDPINYYLDTTFIGDTASVAIQVMSSDSCQEIKVSTIANTIFLEGSPDLAYRNLLRWSPFLIEYGTVYSYEVYRIVDDIPMLITSLPANILLYTDEVNGYNENEADIRYYVVAQVYIELPDGTTKAVFSQSNTILIEQRSKIFMPNAFAPEGTNNVFKPVMVFAENSTFQMVVYDRWGSLLFQTTDSSTGWDGRQNGKIMRQGVYTYIVQIVQLNGEIVEQKGTVLLLR